MLEKFANNAVSVLFATLAVGGVTATLQSGDGVKFPSLSAGEFFYATLFSEAGLYEIVKCTARTSDTLTITRAQEGTTALFWPIGSRLEIRPTAGLIERIYAAIDAGIAASAAGLCLPVNVTGTTYTLQLTDAAKVVRSNNASDQDITIPPNSSVPFPLGTSINFRDVGAGLISLLEGSGVTLNVPDGYLATAARQGSTMNINQVAIDEWDLTGDLKEV